MKYLLLFVRAGCATLPRGIESKAECESQCGSYGYPILKFEGGHCECETRQCVRPKHHGGCEQLAPAPAAARPDTQM